MGGRAPPRPAAPVVLCLAHPGGVHPFGMLKWLDPEMERAWDWDSTAYLGLAFD